MLISCIGNKTVIRCRRLYLAHIAALMFLASLYGSPVLCCRLSFMVIGFCLKILTAHQWMWSLSWFHCWRVGHCQSQDIVKILVHHRISGFLQLAGIQLSLQNTCYCSDIQFLSISSVVLFMTLNTKQTFLLFVYFCVTLDPHQSNIWR